MLKGVWDVGITTKFVLTLLLFALIPLSVHVYSLFQTAEVLKKEVGIQYQAVAEGIAEKITFHLAERIADAQLFSRNGMARDWEMWSQPGSHSIDFVHLLNAHVQASGMYSLIQVVNLEGKLIAVNDRDADGQPLQTEWLYGKNFRSAPWFSSFQSNPPNALLSQTSSKILSGQKIFVEPVIIDPDVQKLFPQESGLTIGLSVPLVFQGQVVGYGSHRMKFSTIEQIFQEAFQRLKKIGLPHAELTLADNKGRLLVEYTPNVHQTENVTHDLNNVLLKNLSLVDFGSIQSSTPGESGYTRHFHPGKQINQIIGYSRMSGRTEALGRSWVVLVQVPEEEAFSLVRNLTNHTLWVMLAGFLLIIPLGIFMSGKVISRLKPFWEVAAKASKGDLTNRVPVKSQDELGQMGLVFNNLLDQWSRMLLQTRSVAHSLSLASGQLSSVGRHVVQVSQSQVYQATQVAAAVEKMSSTAGDMDCHTQSLAATATCVNDSAVRGGEIVVSSLHGMESVSTRMQESANRIQDLGQRSQEIGDIIGVIEDIAEQTNLLALNAAIEAARAGDQGRGFAVVADEVHKLAERTGKATREITTVIESVQAGTHEAVRSMEAGTQEAQAGMVLAREAGIRLTEIVTGVQRVVDMIQHFAGSTKQQSEVSGQIFSNIQQVAQLSLNNESHAQGVATATNHFAALVAELQTSLSRFTLKG
jgi:methyl-accepting chemotaxis protein